MKTQRGAALVEFAIIALLFFIILFGIIEFGRAWFTYNTLVEATRRGARVAAVCPATTSGITMVKQVTIFNPPTGTSSSSQGLLGLAESDVTVNYLDSTATPITITQPLADSSATYNNIAFVQVQIASSFTQTLIIPGFMRTFSVPPIITTLPAESLGRSSYINPPTRSCPFP